MYSSKFARLAFIAAAMAVAFAGTGMLPAAAQGSSGPKVASVTASVAPSTVERGHSGKIVISVKVAAGFHIQSSKPSDPNLIATVFKPMPAPGMRFGTAVYPIPTLVKVAGSNQPLQAYVGEVRIAIPFVVSRSAKVGKLPVAGMLTYQACNSTSCYPPVSRAVSAKVVIK